MLAAPELLAEARDDLATSERLRKHWPADLVAAATEQSVLRQRATTKFDRANAMLFTRDGLEQATSDVVARHRANRFREIDTARQVLDLCCGIGGDLIAIAASCPTITGVDHDEVHAVAARHNASAYDVETRIVVADVTELRLSTAAAVFVDPARRRGRDEQATRGGSHPPLDWCLTLPVERVAIKTAPGLDLATVPAGWEAEFVAVGRDLKEAVLWSPGWAGGARRATVLPNNSGGAAVELLPDPDIPHAPVRSPGRYLLDPSPAVTRAGAVADLAAALDAWQIDAQIAFLSADRPMLTPFGRCLEIQASIPFALKPLAAELRRLDIGAIDIRRRGLAGDVEDIRRRLRPTGARQGTVVLTRVVNKPWAFVCVDVESA